MNYHEVSVKYSKPPKTQSTQSDVKIEIHYKDKDRITRRGTPINLKIDNTMDRYTQLYICIIVSFWHMANSKNSQNLAVDFFSPTSTIKIVANDKQIFPHYTTNSFQKCREIILDCSDERTDFNWGKFFLILYNAKREGKEALIFQDVKIFRQQVTEVMKIMLQPEKKVIEKNNNNTTTKNNKKKRKFYEIDELLNGSIISGFIQPPSGFSLQCFVYHCKFKKLVLSVIMIISKDKTML
jgi:hypothetical protein